MTILVLLATCSVFISAEDVSIYKRLFGKDSPVLDYDNTLELLNSILTLLPEGGWGITAKDVRLLLEASKLDERRCAQPELFRKTYKILMRKERNQHVVERQSDEAKQDDEWNQTIKDFLQVSHERQVKQCIDLFLKQTEQITKHDAKLLDEVALSLPDSDQLERFILAAMIETIKIHMAEGGNILNKFGFRKDERLREELLKLSNACQHVEEILKDNVMTLRWLASNVERNDNGGYQLYRSALTEDSNLMLWLKYDKVCSAYNNGFLRMELTDPIKDLLAKRLAYEYSVQL